MIKSIQQYLSNLKQKKTKKTIYDKFALKQIVFFSVLLLFLYSLKDNYLLSVTGINWLIALISIIFIITGSMKLFKPINISGHIFKYTFQSLEFLLIMTLLGLISYYLYISKFIDTTEKISLTVIVSGIGVITSLWLFYQRLKEQEKQTDNQREQIEIQINQRVDERFNIAINLLGSGETSARTGVLYALRELAIEEKKYRRQIVQILCSHIRSKTNETKYQNTYKKLPSNEIQTTIDLLFKKDGLYNQGFAKHTDFPKADLSHAYLIGANFNHTQCQMANFNNAQCQRASFSHAQCQGVNFMRAQCQDTFFASTQLQMASFSHAQCQRASFSHAQCQGVNFMRAQCQAVIFYSTHCQGANFDHAQCQGADFQYVQCQGAYAVNAQQYHLKERINQHTKFKTLQFSGEIGKDTIKVIKTAKTYLPNYAYKEIKRIVNANKGVKPNYNLPDGSVSEQEYQKLINNENDKHKHRPIITGMLKDSKELQAIINKDCNAFKKLQQKQ